MKVDSGRALVLLMFVSAVFSSSVVVAQGQQLSPGCQQVNDGYNDGLYQIHIDVDSSFFKGERIRISASEPTAVATASSIVLWLGNNQVDSDGFPGTLEYVFPTDTTVTVFWQTLPATASVTWEVQCSYDVPAAPIPALSPKGLAILALLVMAAAYCGRRALFV